MFKKIIIYTIVVFSLLGVVCGEIINVGDLTISNSNNETTKTFALNKIENHKYILKFQHYGVKTKNITIYLYLNNNHIFTIDGNNSHHNNVKPYPNITLDVSSIVIDGNNNISLKLVDGNLGSGVWGYKINNAVIAISTAVKTPIPTSAIILSILAVFFIVSNKKNKRSCICK